MTMYNPPHPGEFIEQTYLQPFPVSQNAIADKLNVARSTFNRLVRKQSGVTPEMALRLSKVLGRSPESWLAMQAKHDLFVARKKHQTFDKLVPFRFVNAT